MLLINKGCFDFMGFDLIQFDLRCEPHMKIKKSWIMDFDSESPRGANMLQKGSLLVFL